MLGKIREKRQENCEKLSIGDRFYLNQYFPISKLPIEFLELYVPCQKKRDLLMDIRREKCDLVGVIGRHAFHIFDKTNRLWIANIEKLGYLTLAEEKPKKQSNRDQEVKNKKEMLE
jgi:hypothetical protein